jgi:hypothetical protein
MRARNRLAAERALARQRCGELAPDHPSGADDENAQPFASIVNPASSLANKLSRNCDRLGYVALAGEGAERFERGPR